MNDYIMNDEMIFKDIIIENEIYTNAVNNNYAKIKTNGKD